MPYQEETIKTILDRLNTQYFLPAIQRRYVWDHNRVIMLFDSIMRGYPISSFLFWELERKNRDKWEIFKFCEVAYSGGTNHIKQEKALGIPNVTLILDGQQRLTSILIGLKGKYKIKQNRQHWIPSNFPEHRLYLDLFKDPNPDDEANEFTGKPYYSFLWSKDVPKNDQAHHWIEVGRILDCRNDNGFYKLKDSEEATFPEGVTKTTENIFERNLWRLYQAFYKDSAISYYVERDQDYDHVLDIFVRANEGGVSLTKPEVIQSMLESKWSGGAKEKIQRLIADINGLNPQINSINLEFIMRVCLVLCNLPIRYRINTFTNANIILIEKTWPKIEDAIRRTFKLINSMGLNRSNLTGNNVLIPVVHFMFHNPEKNFIGTSDSDIKNFELIRRWLILAMLNRIFGRSSDQVLTKLRDAMASYSSGELFPVSQLNKELSRMRLGTEFDNKLITAYLDSVYPVEFLKLSLLYDDQFWLRFGVQQDHIFPKAFFEDNNPRMLSLPLEKQQLFKSIFNRAANLQPLMDKENNEKRDQSFEDWIRTRDKKFRSEHLIPDNDELLKFENFDKFISAREALITEKLKNVI